MHKVNVSFSSDLIVRKYQYQMFLIEEGYTAEEVAEMDLKELRAAVDTVVPLTITNSSLTTHGGKTKKVTVVKVA